MNPNIEKMGALAFAAECWGKEESWLDEAIALRDAYREREALKAATARAEKALNAATKGQHMGEGRYWVHFPDDFIKAVCPAILGEPRFAEGQLVRCLVENGAMIAYNDKLHRTWEVEPVIDRNGDPIYLPVEEA